MAICGLDPARRVELPEAHEGDALARAAIMARQRPRALSLALFVNWRHGCGMTGDETKPIVETGRNCWRIARATCARVIVDAADYYHCIRGAMEKAERRIFIVGWDFDTRIALEPNEKGKGETLGRFFLRLARANPKRQIAILKWNVGAVKQLVHPAAVVWLIRWKLAKAIDFRFDSAHPVGCSHHQKIVVIDDDLAACGGIDISNHRWDTSEHRDGDPHRTAPGGKRYQPWHDATMLMQGPVARDLSELGRERWKNATRQVLPEIDPGKCDWPEGLEPMFEDVDIAISRTRAAYGGQEEVDEIETLNLDIIAAARRFIYYENQYFTSAKIAAAIAKRMAEPDGPEIVLVMPRTAEGWLEQQAMDAARLKLIETIGKSDKDNRFRVYVPQTDGGDDIYVHAKIAIVDDRLLRVGSSNLNNRSQHLDSECDVTIDCALPANRGAGAAITDLRYRLLSEHLGCTADAFREAEQKSGSMVDAIEALRGSGRTLDLLEIEEVTAAQEYIADNELLDPERPDAMLDPIANRGLAKSWAKGLAMIRKRRG
jgi:phosphatidylserine/phosphatidylglycerophosphate/cardiolipin synthase-like enzyme